MLDRRKIVAVKAELEQRGSLAIIEKAIAASNEGLGLKKSDISISSGEILSSPTAHHVKEHISSSTKAKKLKI